MELAHGGINFELSLTMQFVQMRADAEVKAAHSNSVGIEHVFLGLLKLAELKADDLFNAPDFIIKTMSEDISKIREMFAAAQIDTSRTRALLRYMAGSSTTSDEESLEKCCIIAMNGQTSFLLTGDAEFEEEQYMLNSGQELSSTVLKVGHHGSDSSTSAQFLNAVMPQYAVISVGTDNAYGHPSQAVLDNFKQFNVDVFRTDLQGDVICSSNGQSVSFTVEKNKDADTLSTVYQDPVLRVFPFDTQPENIEADNIDYVLNTNTKKYHYPDCSSVNQMKDKNKEFYSGTKEEIIAKGYSPCGNCRP